MKDHKLQWKKKKESTAAEPSGLSFTHFKASSFSPRIAKIDTLLRNMPRKYGFPLPSWQSITDFLILKKAGIFDVEKMHIIQLMNSEFNANNQIDSRRVMHNAETHKTFNRHQMGSRKNMDSGRAALCGVLICNIMHQKVQAGCKISNDAKSCYD
jgi:hypothetical protein